MLIFRGIRGDSSLTLMYQGLQAPLIYFFLGELPQKSGELITPIMEKARIKRSKKSLKKANLPGF
jgi:hypothetical protein